MSGFGLQLSIGNVVRIALYEFVQGLYDFRLRQSFLQAEIPFVEFFVELFGFVPRLAQVVGKLYRFPAGNAEPSRRLPVKAVSFADEISDAIGFFHFLSPDLLIMSLFRDLNGWNAISKTVIAIDI